jgi:acetyltransferase-like isoleucine patch superfamily enzyme
MTMPSPDEPPQEGSSFSSANSRVRLVRREALYTRSKLAYQFVFWFIWGIVKYLPTPIGDVLRYLVLKPFSSGLRSLRIKEGVFIVYPESLTIGRSTGINEYCHIDAYGGVTIGDNVMVGHHTTIQTTDHQIDDLTKPMRDAGMLVGEIVIEDDVYIGAKVFIAKGVRVGQGAVLGAGAIVTRDVPPYAVVAGNPARIVRDRRTKTEPRA